MTKKTKLKSKNKSPPKFVSYSTTCPLCGAKDELEVIQYTYVGGTPLMPDGFELGIGCFCTEDETVHCKKCKEQFSLADVTL